MDLFTKEFASNASAILFPDTSLSSLTFFLLQKLNLEGQWEVAISGLSYPSLYQNVTVGKLMFFDTKQSNSSEYYYLKPGIYHSFSDFSEAMNALIPGSHIHTENSIVVKVSRRNLKIEIGLAREGSGFAFFITVSGHIFG